MGIITSVTRKTSEVSARETRFWIAGHRWYANVVKSAVKTSEV